MAQWANWELHSDGKHYLRRHRSPSTDADKEDDKDKKKKNNNNKSTDGAIYHHAREDVVSYALR